MRSSGLRGGVRCIAIMVSLTAAHLVAVAADPEPADPRATVADRITPAQINRIRFMELRANRTTASADQIPVDRVQVTVPKETRLKYLDWRQGDKSFQGEKARKAFLTKTAPQQLAEIAYFTHDKPEEDEFAGRVEIHTDPDVMIEFKRRVMPLLLTSCASSSCHGNPDISATKLRLYNDPKRSDRTTYANLATLREWLIGGRRLIDPSTPEESLLLQFALRPDETKDRHPGEPLPQPMFQNRNASGYKRIRNWIATLRPLDLERGYGFHLLPPPTPPAPPGEEPAAAEPQ